MADGTLEPEAFERLLAQMRPQLHRYCARMVGSAFDGEDVVQDALARAAEAYGPGIERPESWLFRIAHNTALDALRRRRRQGGTISAAGLATTADPSAAADARVAAKASLAALWRLTLMPRACVVLADVLGHSAEETAGILGTSVAAVKASLHRGRAQLQAGRDEVEAPRLDATERTRLQAYADHFNAREFDALRDLLAEDVRLDLVNRTRLAGRKDVSVYFSRYADAPAWRWTPAMAEGRPVLLARDPVDHSLHHVVLLDWADGKISAIRDFLHADYVIESLDVAGG